MKKQTKTNKNEMSVTQSMGYTLKLLWQADKGCVIFSFYKNCTEMIFLAFFFVYMTQAIFTAIEKQTPFINLVKLICFFCVLHIVIHIASAGYAYYIRLKTPKVYRHIFNKVIHKASDIELTRYEQPDFYDKFSKALDECLNKAMDGLSKMSFALGSALAAISAMGIVAVIDPWLIVFVFPPVVGSFLFGVKQNNEYYLLRNEETPGKRRMDYAKRVFYEKKYAAEIRLYGIRNILFQKHNEGYHQRYEVHVKHRKKIAFYQIIERVVFMGITTFSSYIYVTFIVKANTGEKVGAYVAILSTIGFITWTVKEAVTDFIESGRYCMYMNNLKEFLEYEPGESTSGTKNPPDTLGDLAFHNVSFTYKGSDTPVINQLNLTIKKGERIALVGENGAGKTTLIKLLMGLYPVSKGEITAGGCNINEFEPKEYHNHFGTVFQDLQIFALPLSENVLMKTPETQEERQKIVEALMKAQFGDKLAELPAGIDTMVTKEFDNDGFVCSGGQAQKIAIARVFAKDPDVVILDEPSSALDPIAEYNMYDNMMQVSEGKTVIFISHRLSSARIADKIYFLEHGKIKEAGSHDQLIALDGSYAKMFHLQAQNYQESIPELVYQKKQEQQLSQRRMEVNLHEA